MAFHDVRKRFLEADPAKVGFEEGGENGRIVGYAAVFDQWAVIGRKDDVEYREIIRRTAFDYAITNQQDVRALIEHDSKLILARVSAGTLRLSTDDYGLRFDFDLQGTTRARDLREDVRARNIVGASFGYLPRPGGELITTRSEDGRRIVESEITSADLYDVSPTGNPAYVGTVVETRSADEVRDQAKRILLTACKARITELNKRISK